LNFRIWTMVLGLMLTLGLSLTTSVNPAQAAVASKVAAVSTVESVKAAAPQVCNTVVNDDMTIASKTCKTAPALNAWGYCTVTPTNLKITFYRNQGYCGDSVQFNKTALLACRDMGSWSNWAASVVNYTSDMIMSDRADCTGSPSQGVPANTTDPDLYANPNIGRLVSSFKNVA
jgi:hypothetical protein